MKDKHFNILQRLEKDEAADVLIGFLPATTQSWITELTGEMHVCSFRFRRSWILYDWGLDGVHALPVDRSLIDDTVEDIERAGGDILLYQLQPRANRLIPPLVFHCASWQADLLYLPGTVWTSSGLRRMLLKHGAVVL